MLQDRYPHLHLTLQVDVEVDVQGIIRKTGSQTLLVRFVCFSGTCTAGYSHERKRKWEDRKAKLERTNLDCQAAFGHLD
ncbi:uncharacterized protein ATNIH1004_010887 [Aspergillus tanneri]|uniref:Uncharacterized protein n=1 Tax=Aspergillus tanneri TaxID=1220188 RepID=A0A5M9M5A3_9EURO|nr:uncharacterized protein ATNIH1004_010887 [Aspergillus tanneri]KAA8641948.1 hypothetical protein ATNIH1004_010887 [Aspergillus tanneri]